MSVYSGSPTKDIVRERQNDPHSKMLFSPTNRSSHMSLQTNAQQIISYYKRNHLQKPFTAHKRQWDTGLQIPC